MNGVSGSGKTWLSERIAAEMGAIRIRSDVERKRLGGGNLYTPEMSRRTYARLLEGAESCLLGGVDTIVDAAFLAGRDRRTFRELAKRLGCQFIVLACDAGRAALAQRIEKRALLHTDPSDATVAILDWQLQNSEPLAADEQTMAISIDTTKPRAAENAIEAIRSHLGPIDPSPSGTADC
jgi:hypothetical protein